MALAGHVSRAMMDRYSHIRMEAKRRAVDTMSGTDFDSGGAKNWAHYFISENPEEAKSLKGCGEPGRPRTYNPLIKRLNLASMSGHDLAIPFSNTMTFNELA